MTRLLDYPRKALYFVTERPEYTRLVSHLAQIAKLPPFLSGQDLKLDRLGPEYLERTRSYEEESKRYDPTAAVTRS